MARGLGSRMRREADAALTNEQAAAAASGAKAMMPVASGRPFLDHVLTHLADAGLVDVCLVIGPEHTAIRDYYDQLDPQRVRISFAEQAQPRGTADAVAAAGEFVGADRFVVVNGDNLYPTASVRALIAEPGLATVGFHPDGLVTHSNIPVDRIRAFALLQTDAAGELVNIVEKPTAEVAAALSVAGTPLISMNCWLLGPAAIEACGRIEPSPRGEFELADAVRALLADRVPISVVPSQEGVWDLSSRGDVQAVTAALAGDRVAL
ncbi:MAG: nucleotidyltransferase family protein [Propionibacteriaceae bacterium]|nr:nucleotidyltransferase family protein [Propionibacteriaceae bacterium]